MAKSAELDQVISLLKSREVDESQGATEGRRRSFEGLTDGFNIDVPARYSRVNAGGVAAEWVTAEGASESRVVLYFHGGGYIIGSPRTHRAMMAYLSQAAGARVLSLDYRLAPEFRSPHRWRTRRRPIAGYCTKGMIRPGSPWEEIPLAEDSLSPPWSRYATSACQWRQPESVYRPGWTWRRWANPWRRGRMWTPW